MYVPYAVIKKKFLNPRHREDYSWHTGTDLWIDLLENLQNERFKETSNYARRSYVYCLSKNKKNEQHLFILLVN